MKRIIFVLLVCILLTGCFGGGEKEDDNKVFEMAQEYLLKKYNISLKESDVKDFYNDISFSSGLTSRTSSYTVKIEKNGREFTVRLDTDDTIAECVNYTCTDDYEKNSILAGIESFIASRLSIPSSNVRVFTEDFMLFLNRKYSTADTIINNQQYSFKMGVLINTEINDDMVKRLASNYPFMELYLYKMSNGTNIRNAVINSLSYESDVRQTVFENISSIYLENEYVCKNTCDVKKYKLIRLNNGVIVKSSDMNMQVKELNLSNNVDIVNKVSSCNKRVVSLYNIKVNDTYHLYSSTDNVVGVTSAGTNCNVFRFSEGNVRHSSNIAGNYVIAITE